MREEERGAEMTGENSIGSGERKVEFNILLPFGRTLSLSPISKLRYAKYYGLIMLKYWV